MGTVEENEETEDRSTWKLRIIDPEKDSVSACKLCHRGAQKEDSDLRLGPLYSYGFCLVHHYCLMFSSGLNQEGEDDEGIKGFLPDSIVKEWRRGSMLKCFHCKNKYATVGCAHSSCKRGYHLPCGLENESLQQFFGNFASFCSVHRPIQAPLARVGNGSLKLKEAECGVCLDPLEEVVGNSVLWTPCCGGWAHRPCVERMALVAGSHHFKCPLCNNKDEFAKEMEEFGIYVPDQDAEWEAGDAFGDQLQRHDRCDAEECQCPDGMTHPEGKHFPDGRKYDEEDTEWEIMLCVCCGHQGIHVKCGGLSLARPRWKCDFCKQAVKDLPSRPVPVFTRVKRAANPPDQEFTRKVLSNLTFRVTNRNINVDVHKNRADPNDPVVARFEVTGAPHPKDILLPVSVRKEVTAKERDKVKNIPCPWDDCNALLNRIEFSSHLAAHKGHSTETEDDEEKSTILEGQEVKVGAEIDVRESDGKVYKAIVLKMEGANCFIHYKGWAASWDEWLKIPEESSEQEQKEEVSTKKVPAKSDKRKHSTSSSASSSCSPNQKEPPPKKLKPEVVSEVEISNNVVISMSTPRNQLQGLSKSAPSSDVRESPSQEETKSTPTVATSSKATPVLKASSKKAHTPDGRQKTIMSFFKKFDPASQKLPQLTSRVEEDSDEVEILEKVSPQTLDKKAGVEEEFNKKAEVKVVNSPLGFFKLADEEVKVKEGERSAKFTCQHCKMTFSNMLTWKSHEDGHIQAKPSCTPCDKKFDTEKQLEKHKQTVHGPETVEGEAVEVTYYCDQCDKTTKSVGGLARHKKQKHETKQAEEQRRDEPEVIELNTTTEDESSLEVEEIPVEETTAQPSVKDLSKLMDDWMD